MGYFQREKMTNQVTRILCPGDVYVYLVEGSRSAALIDTGFGVGSLRQYVESLTDLPVTVLLTHGHLDHAGGAGEFEEVYLNYKDLELARQHTSIAVRSAGFCEGKNVHSSFEFVPPKPVEEYLPLTDGQRFELGGMTVTMLELPGHTPGSMCVLLEELRTMLLGDACNSLGFLQLPGSLSVAEYGRAMKEFAKHEEQFDTTWYSHPHNFGGKEIIQETIQLCDEIVSGVRCGIPYGTSDTGKCVLIAREVDENEHPKDGKTANFIYSPSNELR
ncbi:MAG: MBL fold metallo-hydrolase [Lachnospiraceae bacterium]|nr:MBL fold metallo-hydrolase [Lachnospiraceae bacterium]